jgi:hypothetical protein
MVEPQPSKLIMPVRSRSAALFRRAAQKGCGGSAAGYAFPVIPRISRGRIRPRRRVSRFGETREGLGDHRIAVLRRVLVAKRGCRTGVAGPRHEFPSRCALSGGPRQAGAPQVVEVDLGSPSSWRAPCHARLRGCRRSLPPWVRSGAGRMTRGRQRPAGGTPGSARHGVECSRSDHRLRSWAGPDVAGHRRRTPCARRGSFGAGGRYPGAQGPAPLPAGGDTTPPAPRRSATVRAARQSGHRLQRWTASAARAIAPATPPSPRTDSGR